MRSNSDENSFEILDRKMLPVISLFSIVASILVVVTSALKAYLYSNYFGIGMSNFDYISTAKEMVVCVGPFLILGIAILLFDSFNYDRLDASGLLNKISETVILVIIVLLIGISTYLVIVSTKVWNIESYKKPILSIVTLVFFLMGFYEIWLFDKKSKKDPDDIGFAIKILVWAIAFVVILPLLIINIILRCSPADIHEFEITKNESGNYVVISDYNDCKIAMACTISEEKDSINIKYGEYVFIDPRDYKFEYKSFENVYCSEAAEKISK